jgi:phosphohistidine phosphatase
MIRLYLLRHGIAVTPGTPGIADDERPLTPRGRKRMRQIACGLKSLGLKLDRLITSPLPRALETAEIVAEALGGDYLLEQADALRADRSADSIRQWLMTRTEPRLMIVGHNPAFSELPGLLVTGEPIPLCELRKGGVAAFANGPDGGIRLDWLARPRLLRRVGR